MFAYLEGRVKFLHQDHIVLLVNGVGYKVFVSPSFKLSYQHDDMATLHVETIVKEDQISLYGFVSEEEKELFIILMGVQGVGAKMALAMFGALQIEEIYLAITAGDVSSLCRAPGIGKKLAGRIVQELQDKLGKSILGNDRVTVFSSSGTAQQGSATMHQDLAMALSGLGYAPHQSYKIAAQIIQEYPEHDIASLIPIALQKMT